MFERKVYEEDNFHQVSVAIVQALPCEVNPGDFITFKVRISCSLSCDLKGQLIKIADQTGSILKEAKSVIPYGTAFETDQIVLKAPIVPGEYTWKVVYPKQEMEGCVHEEVSMPFTFKVKPEHKVSLAVWDVSSPIVSKSDLHFKVGARCLADCKLTDKIVDIYNQLGVKVGSGKLGDQPWPETTALYWTEIVLSAPEDEGTYFWQVKLQASEGHCTDDSASFSFRVVKSPECILTVKLVEKDHGLPISNASVILHPYRTRTDNDGIGQLAVVKGEYQLYVAEEGYEFIRDTIRVTDNQTITVEIPRAHLMSDD